MVSVSFEGEEIISILLLPSTFPVLSNPVFGFGFFVESTFCKLLSTRLLVNTFFSPFSVL